MRPSIARLSEMPGPQQAWSKWWGDVPAVHRQRGVIQYTLSPYAARAAPNLFRKYIFNGYRRISAEAFYFMVPIGLGYATYTWARSYDEWQNSKAGHLALAEHGEHHE